MSAMMSQITTLTIVYSTVYADQRKHQSSASLACVRGIHRWPVNSPHKAPVTRKMFPFDDVIMRKYVSSPWISSTKQYEYFWLWNTSVLQACQVHTWSAVTEVSKSRIIVTVIWKRYGTHKHQKTSNNEHLCKSYTCSSVIPNLLKTQVKVPLRLLILALVGLHIWTQL